MIWVVFIFKIVNKTPHFKTKKNELELNFTLYLILHICKLCFQKYHPNSSLSWIIILWKCLKIYKWNLFPWKVVTLKAVNTIILCISGVLFDSHIVLHSESQRWRWEYDTENNQDLVCFFINFRFLPFSP